MIFPPNVQFQQMHKILNLLFVYISLACLTLLSITCNSMNLSLWYILKLNWLIFENLSDDNGVSWMKGARKTVTITFAESCGCVCVCSANSAIIKLMLFINLSLFLPHCWVAKWYPWRAKQTLNTVKNNFLSQSQTYSAPIENLKRIHEHVYLSIFATNAVQMHGFFFWFVLFDCLLYYIVWHKLLSIGKSNNNKNNGHLRNCWEVFGSFGINVYFSLKSLFSSFAAALHW